MKKILIIMAFTILLLGVWQICQAQQQLLLDYPEIRGFDIGIDTPLSGVIQYIYMFALGAVGFVALLAIMIGAVMYVTSAGNPSKANDAKDRIMSAILGIILLLASVLILKTINPELTNIGVALPGFELAPRPPGGLYDIKTYWYCYYCCHEFPYAPWPTRLGACNLTINFGCLGLSPTITDGTQAADVCEKFQNNHCRWKGGDSQARETPCLGIY